MRGTSTLSFLGQGLAMSNTYLGYVLASFEIYESNKFYALIILKFWKELHDI